VAGQPPQWIRTCHSDVETNRRRCDNGTVGLIPDAETPDLRAGATTPAHRQTLVGVEVKTAKFEQAALEFCHREERLSEYRKAMKRCTEMSRPDYPNGDPGQGPCYLQAGLGHEEMCDACRNRIESRAGWETALAKRRQAKRRLMYAYGGALR